jgi:hypothetical protein
MTGVVMAVGTTYSFKDLSGAFVSPAVVLPFVFQGQVGLDSITITNSVEHGAIDIAADGLAMPSFIAGDNGNVVITCQQTSILHKYLLAWVNIVKTAAMNGDLTNWANSTLMIRNALDGSQHIVEGILPSKISDKSYQAQGQKISWTLYACNIVSL